MTKEQAPNARLLHYASDLELWHSPDGETFASISIDDLRHFVNSSDQHFFLFVCWLIVALWGRARNHPVLIINGEQGSDKSNLMRFGQSLTDPSKGRALSFDIEGFDLPTLAGNLHVLAFDNVSGLDARKSDLLCRISTGAGIVRRRLYTDNEPTLFEGSRAATINGIPDLVGRPDLAVRSLIMELHAIGSKNQCPEEEWWAEWEFARPFVLGALCDALSCAWRKPAHNPLSPKYPSAPNRP